MSAYWLGVATLPALCAAAFVAFVAWLRVMSALERRGLTFDAKVRDTSKISDYTLRHDIWWERSLGPIFVGGWYREPPGNQHAFTRWIGIGSANGPCIMALHKRVLG